MLVVDHHAQKDLFWALGVPYFNTFFLKGNPYEIKVYTFFSLVT